MSETVPFSSLEPCTNPKTPNGDVCQYAKMGNRSSSYECVSDSYKCTWRHSCPHKGYKRLKDTIDFEEE